MSSLRRAVHATLALLLTTALAGCVTLPESGPVVETRPPGDVETAQAAAIDAVPPRPGDLPNEIVKGFLEAMTAFPVQTSTAREYLAREAQPSWDPDASTIIYTDSSTPRVDGSEVAVTLSDPESLDAEGAWQGPLPPGQRVLRFPMVIEDGEYRIAVAPDALIVPASWFAQRFRQVSLYFFDRTAQILVPEPVFVPRDKQLATTLIDGLLAGPGPDLAGVSRSFLPPDLTVGLSVPVSADGVADIRLVGGAGQQNAEVVEKMLAQLAWTLRQEPTISSLRLTVGDQQVRLPGGASEFGVDDAPQYDPTGYRATPILYGLREGLLFSGEPESLTVADGPLGVEAYGLRSVSVNLAGSSAAGITRDGRRVLLAPVTPDPAGGPVGEVLEVFSGAVDLLPPAWDFTDRLWMVDRTASGARVIIREAGRLRSLRVPRVSGRDVRSFMVSRDGTRFVAVVRTNGVDGLRVGRIEVDFQGRVRRAVAVRTVRFRDTEPARVTDIAWSSPTSIALLSQVVPGELFEVRTVAVDGAPAGTEALSTTVPARVIGIAGSPVEDAQQYAVTRDALVDLSTGALVPLEARISSLDYVG